MNKDIVHNYYPKDSPHLEALRLVRNNSKVLSVGCGCGREAKYLSNHGCKVTAIDIDEEAVISTSLFEPRARCILASGVYFNDNETYDYIVCLWNTINYMNKEERIKFIRNCYRLLKPNGTLIMTTAHLFQNLKYSLSNLRYRRMYYYFPWEIMDWFNGVPFVYEIKKQDKINLIVARKI